MGAARKRRQSPHRRLATPGNELLNRDPYIIHLNIAGGGCTVVSLYFGVEKAMFQMVAK